MSSLPQNIDPEKPLGGRYKLISQLGAGGFSHTFLAQDLHLPGNPQCVLKQFKPQISDTQALQMARRLFEVEARVLYQLGNHNQIPRLLAHFEDNQEFYLAQELIEGEPLTEELAESVPWSEVRVITLLQDLLTVLSFVHQQQVIHRDVKPSNLIRRRKDDKIVLIDFGAVKQVSNSQVVDANTGETTLTMSVGTKGYMPYEQLAGNPRFSSDIYAVGMLAIQALSRIHPQRLEEDPETAEINWRNSCKTKRLRHHLEPVSSELAEIIDQMVCYDFRCRYSTAMEALEAVEGLSRTLTDSRPLEQYTQATVASDIQQRNSLKAQSEAGISESLESGTDAKSTEIWIPTQSPNLSQPSASSQESTEILSPSQLPLNPSSTSATKLNKLGVMRQRLVKVWPIFAFLTVLGITFPLTKTLLFEQLITQITNPNGTPATDDPLQTPTPEPLVTPSPTPTPLSPELQAQEFLKQANELKEAQEYSQALEVYEQAISSNPNLAPAYWGKCYTLNKLQQPALAIVACNDALAIKPDYAEAVWSKGNALEQQELLIQARRLYEKATALKPDFAEGWVSLGVALQKVGRSEEAIIALEKGIKLKRDNAQAWSTLGEALWNMGRFNRAIASLDKALQIQPDHPEALKLRQHTRERLGR
ncbi:MAG: tetratricopeptide repeat protein [Symploca sp. SIO3C6]|uniref:non-specific serine/threonine protein kinase n=1 Tax=Symploca sp. SIO1C4 TaxID=2607765 RepID=A0A6B3NHG5_9CYAN|nr:tetratricopeptide repeat protein [Symploca sp. SIO3C6]NER31187.1 tetratricopeptide repeat protein [Symploca sp. SIO1C4]NET05296.1 tetratricopeptide repeat protein [Symploca sp. SIO2B6]